MPKKPKLISASTAVGGAAVIASPLIVVGLMSNTAPMVDSVQFDTQWTNKSIPAQISFAEDNPNNQRVRVELNGGAVYLDDQGAFSIDDNGHLTITYDKEVLYSADIASIDAISPQLQLDQNGPTIQITLTDNKSGVDFESIQIHDSNGQAVNYLMSDNMITLEKDDNDTYVIFGKDIAGNQFEYELQTVEDVS